MNTAEAIVETLLEQKRNRVERGFYWENQIAFAYNSEKMEGNPLTEDQTRSIFETRTVTGRSVPLDAVQETTNHFDLFDRMLETYKEPLTRELMWEYHSILKGQTCDDKYNPDFVVGGWKTIPNSVAGITTTAPSQVDEAISRLINAYDSKQEKTYRDIVGFHVFFENIHPFQDGNGRIGRMLMFKECLRNDLTPFIVLDERKADYYKGLATFERDEGYMLRFTDEMVDLYLKEYAALVPEYHLLPQLAEHVKTKELKPEGFFVPVNDKPSIKDDIANARNAVGSVGNHHSEPSRGMKR